MKIISEGRIGEKEKAEEVQMVKVERRGLFVIRC
jgi:hypothetical protein